MTDDDDELALRRRQRREKVTRRRVIVAAVVGTLVVGVLMVLLGRGGGRDRPGPGEREVTGRVVTVTPVGGESPGALLIITNDLGWEGYCSLFGDEAKRGLSLATGDRVIVVGLEVSHFSEMTRLADCRITSTRRSR